MLNSQPSASNVFSAAHSLGTNALALKCGLEGGIPGCLLQLLICLNSQVPLPILPVQQSVR